MPSYDNYMTNINNQSANICLCVLLHYQDHKDHNQIEKAKELDQILEGNNYLLELNQ